MKVNYFLGVAAFLCLALTSCDSDNDNQVQTELNRLDNYLDSVKTAAPVYSAAKWDEIQKEYNETIVKVQEGGKELSTAANAKLEEVKTEYNKLKEKYNTYIREEEAKNDYKRNLRKSLFGEQLVGDDLQFEFVNANNALSVYERFVDNVKKNKEEYTREDWDEIKVLYEALDTRKNEIEKDLKSSDNLKIARKKVEFAGVKAIRRPLSKVKENEDAKQ
ncbi:MAG: hypothetical protein EOO43_23180 [Flavobacterium sp.]|nr:MAG: hypothetical protein EOO43_23180 [Flavobacterium sp.]